MSNFLVDDDTFALRQAKTAVDKAATTFEQEKARLYRQDGKLKYGQDEHNERLTALLEPVRDAVAEAKQTADQVRQRCEEEKKIQNADPLLRLTEPAEQQEVTFKQGLIEDDTAKSPLPALAQRLEAITIHGSKVEQLLYLRYAQRRAEEERQKAFGSSRSTLDGTVVGRTGPIPEGLGQLLSAVKALEAKTVDAKLQERLKRVEERRNAATSLVMHATGRLRDADGSNERARKEQAQFAHNSF